MLLPGPMGGSSDAADGSTIDLTRVLEDVGEGGSSLEAQLQTLRERLRHVARAAERSEEQRKHDSRVYKAELKRAQDNERDK